jgi:long-chain fatty acid transport protein
MRHGQGSRLIALAAVAGAGLAATPAAANNGLNFIGAGVEAVGMGGADIAVARDPMAVDNNPAGLAAQRNTAIEQQLAVAREVHAGFSDAENAHQAPTNKTVPVGNGAGVLPLSFVPATLGFGLLAQGGSGGAFSGVTTPFGTQDQFSAKFAIAQLSFGGALQATDRLSLGASVSVSYARLDQEVFPGTSSVADPAHPFFGTTLRDASTFAPGFRLGAQYRMTDRLTLGALYIGETTLNLSGDRFSANEQALGFGQVAYRNVRLTGLAEPQEAGIGAAYRVTERLLLAADIKWLDWSDAIKNSTLTASNPDNPNAPQSVSQTMPLDWRDQYVLALGGAFDLTPQTRLWAGYNYGRNPIPASSANPLLAAIGEHHLTAGVGWRPLDGWMVGAAVEYLVPTEQRAENPNLPLASDVRVSTGYLAIHLGLRREW